MNEPDVPWGAWRSLNDSRAGLAESYAKNAGPKDQEKISMVKFLIAEIFSLHYNLDSILVKVRISLSVVP